jgi:polyferredoxin
MDPLVALSTLLSGGMLIKGFLWAAGVVGLTILLGRVFCGFICPLGSIHHAAGALKPSLKGARMLAANRKTPSQRIKYVLLTGLLVSAVLGLNMTVARPDVVSSFARAVVPPSATAAVVEAMAARL